MSRATARRAFDGLERRLVPLAAERLAAGLALAGLVGRARNAMSRRWPAPGDVRALFGCGAAAARRVAARIAAGEARTRLLLEVLRRRGLEPLRPLVRWRPGDLEGLQPPAILGTFHLGAWEALGPAIERLPAPVSLLRNQPLYRPAAGVELVTTAGGAEARAAAFHRALDRLESGGFVVMAIDVDTTPGLPVACLGRRLELPRGAFALARRTGAPIHPLTARWLAGVEAAAAPHTPPAAAEADPDDVEQALALAIAAWLDRYLREQPGDLGLGLLRELLGRGDVKPGPARR